MKDDSTPRVGGPAAPASEPGAPVTARHASSAGDMLHGIGTKLLYAATRVALPPLALAHMGLGDYGLWAACFVLVGYLGMAASGFTLVYLRGTALHHAQGDVAAIGRLLSTGMLAMAALGALLLGALALALPQLLALFKVPLAQQPVATVLWLGAAAVFLADMSVGAFANVLHAIGRVRQEQRVWVVAFVLEALLIVAFLQVGWGVLGLLAAFALRYVFSASANALLACRALPGLRLSWRSFDAGLLRSFFGFGAGMQASGLLASALHSADRLLAGAMLGPQATALVEMAGKLPGTAASFASSASTVAVSASARHDVQGQAAGLLRVYSDASRITVACLALVLPFIAVFAAPLVLAWLGAGSAQAAVAPLLPCIALALHAHMLTGPANAVSRGRGRLGADFQYLGLRAAALGAVALAFASLTVPPTLPSLVTWLAAAQGAAALAFLVFAHRRLNGTFTGLASQIAAPTAAAYALAGALHWALPAADDRMGALWLVAGAALVWLPAAATLLAAWLTTPAERRQVALRLLPPLTWRRA